MHHGSALQQPAAAAGAGEAAVADQNLAAAEGAHRPAGEVEPLIGRPAEAVVQCGGGDGDAFGGIPQRDVGVGADGNRALARPQPIESRGLRRRHRNKALKRQPSFVDAFGKHQRQPRFQAGETVGDTIERCGEAIAQLAGVALQVESRMIGGEDGHAAVLQSRPERILTVRVAQGRAAAESHRLPRRGIESLGCQHQILRAGFGEHRHAALLRPAHLLDGIAARHVHQHHRHAGQFGQRDRVMDGVALRQHRARHRQIANLGVAGADELLHEPGDHVVALGVHQRHGAFAPHRREHIERGLVVEPQCVIGQVDLDRREALADQRRQILVERRRRGVRHDQVEAVVDHAGGRAGLVVVDHLAQPLATVLRGERHDGGGAAADRGDARALEGVDGARAGRDHLLDMAVRVDAARQCQQPGGIDGLGAAVEVGRDRRDPSVGNADRCVLLAGLADNAGIADHDIEALGHGASVSSLSQRL